MQNTEDRYLLQFGMPFEQSHVLWLTLFYCSDGISYHQVVMFLILCTEEHVVCMRL